MKDIAISVVTPSFNQAHFIEKTMSSVILQEGVNVQYIVVDGLSTDGSIEKIEAMSSSISKVIIESDTGQADAIRKGFRFANGKICGFLNSDDFLIQGALEFVESYFLAHPEVDAIYSHRVFVDENDRIKRFWILPQHNNYFISRWDFIPQETCFWRKELMDSVGGIDTSYQFALDYDLFVRMMRKGKFVRVNKLLAAFREHGNAKTSTIMSTVGNQEIQRVRDSHVISLGRLDRVLGFIFSHIILAFSNMYSFFCKKRVADKLNLKTTR